VSEWVSEDGYTAPTWLYTILHFSHDPSNRSPPPIPSISLKNFPVMPDLLSKLSKFLEHKTFSSNCITLLVSTLNLSPICWWKQSSPCWMLLLPWQCWIQSHVYILRHLLSHYTNMPINVQQDVNKCPTRCNYAQFILSVNCSTCFEWFLHPSSGTQITVSTATGTSQPLLLPVGIVEELRLNSSMIARGSKTVDYYQLL